MQDGLGLKKRERDWRRSLLKFEVKRCIYVYKDALVTEWQVFVAKPRVWNNGRFQRIRAGESIGFHHLHLQLQEF